MFMWPLYWFQGMNSASLCSLAGRYENPIPPRCLAPIDFLKIPALSNMLILQSLGKEQQSNPPVIWQESNIFNPPTGDREASFYSSNQCGGSGMFIPDPGSWFLPIPDPGSRIPDLGSRIQKQVEKRGVKKIFWQTFFCSHFTKCKII
jgi:hypothetical protein